MIKYLLLIIFLFSINTFSAEKKKFDPKLKSEVLLVLEENEKLHASFFKYNGSKVEKNTKSVITIINKVTHPELKKLFAFSKARLKSITSKRNREDNNKSYHIFSMALIYIMKTYELGDDYQGFWCPMVRKQWVQNIKKQAKVHNPYAPSMPNCGEHTKV